MEERDGVTVKGRLQKADLTGGGGGGGLIRKKVGAIAIGFFLLIKKIKIL